MKILEFTTEQDALTALTIINAMAADWWVSQGYTVLDNNGAKELVGKNAKTGEDQPHKTKTLSWDIPTESPDGTWYIQSLTGTRPEWSEWATTYAAFAGPAYVEKDFPAEWVQDEV